MTNEAELELLIEIAKLLKKYSPELSKSMAENLSSPEFIKRLVSVLSPAEQKLQNVVTQEIHQATEKQSVTKTRSSGIKGSKTSKKKSSQPAKRNQISTNSYPGFLNDLKTTEPHKSALLIKFHKVLIDKTVLRTLQDIRDFASEIGLPQIKATSRNQAIISLIKDLLPLDIENLRTKIDEIMPVKPQDDRSLEAWADIILDKELRTKQED